MGFGGENDHGKPPSTREEIGELLVDDLGFVDAVAWWTASDRFGVAGVDAEFIIENGAADALWGERVPVLVDNRCEAGFVIGVEGGRKGNRLVKVGLVLGSVPNDAVGA